MSKLNSNYTKLQAGYLFPEITRRVKQFQQNNPEAKIIKMGIGDTVLPIPKIITEAMSARAKAFLGLPSILVMGIVKVSWSYAKLFVATTKK